MTVDIHCLVSSCFRVSYCRQKCKSLDPIPDEIPDSEEEEEEEEAKDAERMNTENIENEEKVWRPCLLKPRLCWMIR